MARDPLRRDRRMSEDDEDARLVAYIDGELDKDERAAVEERLTTDADLRARLMRLREGERPFVAAFEALLERAPVERLQASLAEHVARQERRRTSMRDSWTLRTGVLGAAAGVILFCAGIAIGRYGPSWLPGAQMTTTKTGGSRSSNIQPFTLPKLSLRNPLRRQRTLPWWAPSSACL